MFRHYQCKLSLSCSVTTRLITHLQVTGLNVTSAQNPLTTLDESVAAAQRAAAPQSSLMFMFWGGVVVFPLMLLYTLISYSVFRGKIRTTALHY